MIILKEQVEPQSITFIPRNMVANTIVLRNETTNVETTIIAEFYVNDYYLTASAVFDLKENTFYNLTIYNDSDKKTYSGLWITADVELLGMGQQSSATLGIYGMSQSDMNRLETTGSIQQQNTRINKIMVAAGEVGGAMYVVHEGFIDTAYPVIHWVKQ